MEEKEDIKLEELFSYGMSKEGFEKLLEDIQIAVKEGKESINCDQLSLSDEDKNKLTEVVNKANSSIDNSLKEIEELFNRVLSDWKLEKGGTNE